MKIRPSLWFILALFAVSCGVESEQPLSDPAQSQPDSRLAGVWYDIDHDTPKQFLHVVKQDKAWMDLVLLGHNKKGAELSHFRGFPTPTKERDYLNITGVEQRQDQTPAANRYLILQYVFSGPDTVSFWILEKGPMEKAIGQGQLQGRMEKGDKEEDEVLVLSDSGPQLLRYLQEHEADELFDHFATFRRLSF